MEIKAEVVFVTDLEVSGFMNGVLNMAFSTAQFVPMEVLDYEDLEDDNSPKTKTVVAQVPVVTANLRFDLRLAQIIHDRLGALIEENTKPRVSN